MSKAHIHLKGDERILGESDFVEEVLAEQKEQFEHRYWLKAQGYDFDRVVERVAEMLDMDREQILERGNQPLRVKARSLVCYWAVRQLGLSGTSVGKLLKLSQSAVSRSVARGEKLSKDMQLTLMK
jgi:chromosomal replication initiation ATPase DnaA